MARMVKGKGFGGSDFQNTKNADDYPKDPEQISGRYRGETGRSSAVPPPGKKDMSGVNGTIDSEVSRERRIKSTKNSASGPKSRDFPFFKHTTKGK